MIAIGPRTKLLGVIAVFVLPMVAAAVAYSGWRPQGHGNYGELLEVAPLQQTAGALADGTRFDLTALRGKWVMTYVGPSACDADCTQLLYLMRQTRVAQGKQQSRIARLWIVSDAGTVAPDVVAQHSGLTVWRPQAPDLLRQFPEAALGAHLYLVDPLGNVMLRFPRQPDPYRLMKDLKLLLKASQIG